MAPQQTYAPTATSDNAADERGLLEVAPRQGSRSLPKRGLFLAMGLATAGAGVVWMGGRSASRPTLVQADWASATELDADKDPCDNYPFLSLDTVEHSNLGSHGPDSGSQEGIVYKATEKVPGHPDKSVYVTVNASATYEAGHARYNGIHGKYGLITMRAGTEAEFTFKFYNESWAPMTIPKQEFTFFDLDQSSAGDNREYIVVKAAQEWLTKNTEIQVTDLPDGQKKFMSSMPGSGSDNPKDPLALTIQQKNRAVTVEFLNFSELKVTLGCTAGSYARYFMFVIRPSLLCARTVDGTKDDTEVITVRTTTPAPDPNRDTTTAAPEEDDCLVQIPVIKFCIFKKAWKFW